MIFKTKEELKELSNQEFKIYYESLLEVNNVLIPDYIEVESINRLFQ